MAQILVIGLVVATFLTALASEVPGGRNKHCYRCDDTEKFGVVDEIMGMKERGELPGNKYPSKQAFLDGSMCVLDKYICDSIMDCPGGPDEDIETCKEQHKDYCTDTMMNPDEGKYAAGMKMEYWKCGGGDEEADNMCIEKCRVCDCIEDCPDGSDEDERCKNGGASQFAAWKPQCYKPKDEPSCYST